MPKIKMSNSVPIKTENGSAEVKKEPVEDGEKVISFFKNTGFGLRRGIIKNLGKVFTKTSL